MPLFDKYSPPRNTTRPKRSGLAGQPEQLPRIPTHFAAQRMPRHSKAVLAFKFIKHI